MKTFLTVIITIAIIAVIGSGYALYKLDEMFYDYQIKIADPHTYSIYRKGRIVGTVNRDANVELFNVIDDDNE